MKLNYITDVVKILILAASIIITCLIVAIGFRGATIAKEISNAAISNMNEISKDIKSSDIMMYDGLEVYGSEVVNFIKKYLGDYIEGEAAQITVEVKTFINENSYRNGCYIENMRNFSDIKYIKPTAIFHGKVIKNINGVITGVSFIQK